MNYNLPDLLEQIALRPAMYAGRISFDRVEAFLNGLRIGYASTGIDYTWDDYQAAANARGFDARGAIGIVRDFESKGLSDEEMVRELIAIVSDAYRRARERAKT